MIWTAILVGVGLAIGTLLPLSGISRRFLLLLALTPVVAVFDLFIVRSRRTVWFWIRACGFEICTVFAVAFAARYLLDAIGITPMTGVTK